MFRISAARLSEHEHMREPIVERHRMTVEYVKSLEKKPLDNPLFIQ